MMISATENEAKEGEIKICHSHSKDGKDNYQREMVKHSH